MRTIVLMLVWSVMVLDASRLSDLMERYRQAPERQRYRIMNQIKLEIARLNRKRQAEAIRSLRALTRETDARTKRLRHRRLEHHNATMSVLEGRSGGSGPGGAHGPSGPGEEHSGHSGGRGGR